MSSNKSSSGAAVIVEFLKNPLNRKNFDDFFQICFTKTYNYLHKLKNSGWTIPIHDADYHKNISNLTYDILSTFLQSKKNKLYFIIFDYFIRRRITDFDKIDHDEIHDLFCILLWGYTKKELGQISKADSPQIANLKRRIKEITDGEDYIRGKLEAVSNECIYLKKNSDNLRLNLEPISKEELIYFAQKALYDSKARPEWCNKIFKLIDEDDNIQNFVSYSDLLLAVITANATQVELDGNYSARLSTPELQLIRETASKAKEFALDKIATNDLQHFSDKNKVAESDVEPIISAVDKFLIDYSYDSQTDSIPTYFRESLSEKTHARYSQDYKHIFDTIMKKARDYFDDYMKNNL